MINLLLGLRAVNGALGLARGVLKSVTSVGHKSGGYADIHRAALERRGSSPTAAGSVPSDALGATSAPASAGIAHRVAATRSYENVKRTQAEGLMRRLDVDGDSLLAAAELGLSTEEFLRVDTDGNGDVDIEELSKALQAGKVPTWKA